LTLVITDRCVVTFQERTGDCFDSVRDRIRSGAGRIRKSGSDYLAYTLLDALIDSFFPVLEQCGERAEEIEEQVLLHAAPAHIGDIHVLKRELLELRHAIWPLREVVATLLRDDLKLIKKETRVFLRDCADHSFQLLDILEVYREIASGLVDLQLTTISNRMNEAMKVLAIIGTVFMPMTFIAGLYGMNFDRHSPLNMPELGWKYGYLFALGLMLASAVFVVWSLLRRGWLTKSGN
jgi:magnesium transporter